MIDINFAADKSLKVLNGRNQKLQLLGIKESLVFVLFCRYVFLELDEDSFLICRSLKYKLFCFGNNSAMKRDLNVHFVIKSKLLSNQSCYQIKIVVK